MGWLLLNQDYKKHGRTDITDLANDPFVVWQHKYYAVISIFFAWVFPTLVAGFGWGDWKGGLIYAGVLRVVTVQQSSFTINSLGHYLGDQPFDDRRSPRDHWISSLFSLGEGYHNFHHEVGFSLRFPAAVNLALCSRLANPNAPLVSHRLPQHNEMVDLRPEQMVYLHLEVPRSSQRPPYLLSKRNRQGQAPARTKEARPQAWSPRLG